MAIVKIGEGLEEIGEHAFEDCASIHEISIPNVVKAIGKYAFLRCSDLTTVKLGDGLEEIGRGYLVNAN